MRLPWYLKVRKAYAENGEYIVEMEVNSIWLVLMIIKQYLLNIKKKGEK